MSIFKFALDRLFKQFVKSNKRFPTPAEKKQLEDLAMVEAMADRKKQQDNMNSAVEELMEKLAAGKQLNPLDKKKLEDTEAAANNMAKKSKSISDANLKVAQETGDPDGIATATELLSRSAAEAENLKRLSAQQQVRQATTEEEVVDNVPDFTQTTQQAPDPKAEAWANKPENQWFGEDQAMTYAAFGIHRQLIEEGVDPHSDNYYDQVDAKIRQYFPQKFSEEQSAPTQQVAASSRGATGKKNARKIKLTPSQVAIAKRLNVPLEEYAKHIEQGV